MNPKSYTAHIRYLSKQAAKSLSTPHLPFIFTVLYNNGGHLRKRQSQNSEVQFKLIAQANKLASLGSELRTDVTGSHPLLIREHPEQN
jgi:uncharacterized protein (DUF2062 family)